MADIVIAIPSFRRPKGLARLLASLAALQTAERVTVLAGDNDADGQAARLLCETLAAEGYRWPLRAIVVAERGIAQNRSALVAAALAEPFDYLAMLDDDETVSETWLTAMLETAARFEADAVEGPVIGIDSQGMPVEYSGVARHKGATGPLPILEGAGNILLRHALLERMAVPHFDPAFALSGGEDADFFIRLRHHGARFAWCAEAKAFTPVGAAREGLGWVLLRAFRDGNTDMRVFLKHEGRWPARLVEAGKIAAALSGAALAMLALIAMPGRRLAMLRRFCRAAGKAAACLGVHSEGYAVIHGE